MNSALRSRVKYSVGPHSVEEHAILSRQISTMPAAMPQIGVVNGSYSGYTKFKIAANGGLDTDDIQYLNIL